MSYSIVRKILTWLTSPKRLDKEINQALEDIAFLTSKIHIARRMYADVIARKLTVQRYKLIKKRTRLIVKRRHLFNE